MNGQPIAVDDDVFDYVRTSVTNSITSFHKNILKKQGNKIDPETSLLLLALASVDISPAKEYEKEIKENLMPFGISRLIFCPKGRNCQRPSSRRYFPSSDSNAAIVYAAQRGRKRTNDPYGTVRHRHKIYHVHRRW